MAIRAELNSALQKFYFDLRYSSVSIHVFTFIREQVYRFISLRVYGFTSLRVYKFQSLQVYKFTSLNIIPIPIRPASSVLFRDNTPLFLFVQITWIIPGIFDFRNFLFLFYYIKASQVYKFVQSLKHL